jgi:hypothetical protein
MELRCLGKLHGVLQDDGILEVKCGRRCCGYRPGTVVLHRFNLHTGEMTTERYKDPPLGRRSTNGTGNEQPGVRSA